jgi:hypothetical protein
VKFLTVFTKTVWSSNICAEQLFLMEKAASAVVTGHTAFVKTVKGWKGGWLAEAALAVSPFKCQGRLWRLWMSRCGAKI